MRMAKAERQGKTYKKYVDPFEKILKGIKNINKVFPPSRYKEGTTIYKTLGIYLSKIPNFLWFNLTAF